MAKLCNIFGYSDNFGWNNEEKKIEMSLFSWALDRFSISSKFLTKEKLQMRTGVGFFKLRPLTSPHGCVRRLSHFQIPESIHISIAHVEITNLWGEMIYLYFYGVGFVRNVQILSWHSNLSGDKWITTIRVGRARRPLRGVRRPLRLSNSLHLAWTPLVLECRPSVVPPGSRGAANSKGFFRLTRPHQVWK